MKDKDRSQEETPSQNITQRRIIITLVQKAFCIFEDVVFILILFFYPLLQEAKEESAGKTMRF